MKKFTNILRSAFAKRAIFALFALASVAQCFAAGNGMAGINEATSMISSYFDPGTKLIYAIGAVVGLIGGVKVYGVPTCLHIFAATLLLVKLKIN